MPIIYGVRSWRELNSPLPTLFYSWGELTDYKNYLNLWKAHRRITGNSLFSEFASHVFTARFEGNVLTIMNSCRLLMKGRGVQSNDITASV